ncbi:MAG: adenylosuccinate lyase [Bacteroidetes bacterium HGW-Bacteroidetes-6]|jgi:adenylosuccinate lyase|nr:MAG: adenylosuccinate lyase [Bacteroidetes bacterium HGW-Bacteroidetes-6]
MDASLFSVSPVDGRYNKTTQPLQQYFSEFALIRYRVLVEVQYFIALSQLKLSFFDRFPIEKLAEIEKIAAHFSEADAQKIKEIEKTTNHDVKAVEYFLRKKFTDLGLQDYQEFIHFGLTSQDVNNTAFPMMLRDALRNIVLPELELLLSVFSQKTSEWNNISMLARTHGQPASPTTLGKELAVFSERIEIQLALLKQIPATGKFGGATGNFNAHHAAYPQINWIDFANRFMKEELGLNRQQTTTQIEHYDGMANTFSVLASVNTILIDFSRDIWMYVMLEYFKQQVKKDEVGSSAMPHKVNPIDFENAEGNFGMANAVLRHLIEKLPISRLQRDLTDSTVIRNIGVPLAHMMIALKSLQKGMGKLLVNSEKISADLNVNWAVLAEAIQTILRREKYPDPYNALKQLTRGNNRIDRKSLISFIDSLAVNEDVKNELRLLTPENYIGIHKK